MSCTSADMWSLEKWCSVQSLSQVQLFAMPWTTARQASLSITNSRSLLKLMSIESVMPSNHLILCCPFLLPPSISPSTRVFSNESVLCIRWPKDWGFSFSISPSNEYSGLTSFRMDWLDLLAVQGTLKSLLQHRSSKALIFRCSVFFIVQLVHPYIKKWHRWFYLQSRNRDKDAEDKHMDTTGRRGWGDGLGDWDWHIYAAMYKTDN